MSVGKKPWMTPIQYNDTRFEEKEEREVAEVNELIIRTPREDKLIRSKDTDPIDYSKGPHDREFGVDDNQFDAPDDEPVPYANGPNDDQFGEDDEDLTEE